MAAGVVGSEFGFVYQFPRVLHVQTVEELVQLPVVYHYGSYDHIATRIPIGVMVRQQWRPLPEAAHFENELAALPGRRWRLRVRLGGRALDSGGCA